MARRLLFQRPFDDSQDSDILMNVPFAKVINNHYSGLGDSQETRVSPMLTGAPNEARGTTESAQPASEQGWRVDK